MRRVGGWVHERSRGFDVMCSNEGCQSCLGGARAWLVVVISGACIGREHMTAREQHDASILCTDSSWHCTKTAFADGDNILCLCSHLCCTSYGGRSSNRVQPASAPVIPGAVTHNFENPQPLRRFSPQRLLLL